MCRGSFSHLRTQAYDVYRACTHAVMLVLVLSQARPLLTKCMTSLTGFAIGDTLAQVPPPSSVCNRVCRGLLQMPWPRLLTAFMLLLCQRLQRCIHLCMAVFLATCAQSVPPPFAVGAVGSEHLILTKSVCLGRLLHVHASCEPSSPTISAQHH